MIGRITGTLIEKTPPLVCVDVGGVGYEIDVPMSTLYDLPDNGATITLYTHLAVREDAHTLYGFLSPKERSRSEEHTSELQSLMRISYAVFCLQKKKQNN